MVVIQSYSCNEESLWVGTVFSGRDSSCCHELKLKVEYA